MLSATRSWGSARSSSSGLSFRARYVRDGRCRHLPADGHVAPGVPRARIPAGCCRSAVRGDWKLIWIEWAPSPTGLSQRMDACWQPSLIKQDSRVVILPWSTVGIQQSRRFRSRHRGRPRAQAESVPQRRPPSDGLSATRRPSPNWGATWPPGNRRSVPCFLTTHRWFDRVRPASPHVEDQLDHSRFPGPPQSSSLDVSTAQHSCP